MKHRAEEYSEIFLMRRIRAVADACIDLGVAESVARPLSDRMS